MAPHPVDIHVGARIRLRRALLGITQARLAHLVGVTIEQMGDFETGAQRVGASLLHQIAETLGVPLGYFFEALQIPKENGPANGDGKGSSDHPPTEE